MKQLFFLFLAFTSSSTFAQKELFLTTSAGLKLSYNQIRSDKPLPEGVLQHSNWPGFSAALGLEYKFGPHWSVHAQMKTAGIKIGFAKRKTVLYDTISLKYSTRNEISGTSANTNYPVHYQLGVTYYGNPSASGKLTWLLGGGVAYLVNSHGLSSIIRISPPAPQPGNAIAYGKEMDLVMEEDYFKNGFLLNLHAGLDYKMAARHYFTLIYQFNAGLNTIWQYKSGHFFYIDRIPNRTSYENFDVTLRNKGSYSALQVGYKYALFTSK